MDKQSDDKKKPVTFASLKGLKVAKARNTLPRGLKVKIEGGGDGESGFDVCFFLRSQDEPALKVDLQEFALSELKASGFSIEATA